MENTAAARFTAADLPTLSQLQMLRREEEVRQAEPPERQTEPQQNIASAPHARETVNVNSALSAGGAPTTQQLIALQRELGPGSAGITAQDLPTLSQLKVLRRDVLEQEQREREERARLAKERAERERREREEKARLAKERAERERREREEKARLAKEQAERERREREAKAAAGKERAAAGSGADAPDLPTLEQLIALRNEETAGGGFTAQDLPTVQQLAALKTQELERPAERKDRKAPKAVKSMQAQRQQLRAAPAKGTLSADAKPVIKRAKPVKEAPAPRPEKPAEQQRFTAFDFAAEVRRKRMEESGFTFTEEAFHELRDHPEVLRGEGNVAVSPEMVESLSETTVAKPVEGLPTTEQYEKQLQKQPKHSRKRRAGEKPTDEQLEKAQNKINNRRNYLRVLKNTIFTLITVSAVAVLVAVLLLPVLRIYGTSMTPTLDESNLVLSIKGSKFDTGDVIAFYYNNKILVKRVIAQAGDWVNIAEDGTVSVNGKELIEPYVSGKAFGECDIELPYQVPEGRVFVMGDHRDVSIDSRNTSIGCVAEEQIVGRIVYCIWPFNAFGPIQ